MEAWVYISDVHNTPALFSYAVYDSSVDPPYEQANELVLLMTSEQQVFFRATATSRCNDIDEAGKVSD